MHLRTLQTLTHALPTLYQCLRKARRMTVFAPFAEIYKPVCQLSDLRVRRWGIICEVSEFVINAYEDTANIAKLERLSNVSFR